MREVKVFSKLKNSFVTVRPLNDGSIMIDNNERKVLSDVLVANSATWSNSDGMWSNSSSWCNRDDMWTNSSSWSNRDDMWTNSSSWSNSDGMWTNSSSWSNSDGMWSNEGSWSNSDSGGCYLTTACMLSMNASDNCNELMILRDFRDKMIDEDEDFKKIVIEYYKKAPLIVNKIEKDNSKKKIYDDIYANTIIPCINFIKNKQYKEAVKVYGDCYNSLKDKYKVK